LIPPIRADLMEEAIRKMLRDPEQMRTMGLTGYHRVKKEFTFDTQTEKLETIYGKVIQGIKP
jgi:glycosyltransferase involved in cell wall biosynthesis